MKNNNIIKRKRVLHNMWEQEQQLICNEEFIKKMVDKGYPREQILETFTRFGKWKYDFESPKGKISMIQLVTHIPKGGEWEIYAHDNKKLFSYVIRFRTKKAAVQAVNKYLE